jgi:hypothetical protein
MGLKGIQILELQKMGKVFPRECYEKSGFSQEAQSRIWWTKEIQGWEDEIGLMLEEDLIAKEAVKKIWAHVKVFWESPEKLGLIQEALDLNTWLLGNQGSKRRR